MPRTLCCMRLVVVATLVAGGGLFGAGRVAGAAEPAADEAKPEWRKKFEEVYRLDDDEVVKFIPPPFIPERELYFRHEYRSGPDTPVKADGWSFVLVVDDANKRARRSISSQA